MDNINSKETAKRPRQNDNSPLSLPACIDKAGREDQYPVQGKRKFRRRRDTKIFVYPYIRRDELRQRLRYRKIRTYYIRRIYRPQHRGLSGSKPQGSSSGKKEKKQKQQHRLPSKDKKFQNVQDMVNTCMHLLHITCRF